MMDGAGGGADLTNATLTFDDSGSALTTAAISSGTYRPTNLRGTDFPLPAPPGPYAAASLSAFNGIDPNGDWQLYVRDSSAVDPGTISGGWKLELISLKQATSFAVTGAPGVTVGNTPFNITVTAKNADDTVDTGYLGTIHFTSTDPAAILPAPYTFVPADNGVRSLPVTLGSSGSHTITVSDSGMAGYWKLDEGSGIATSDSSGNNNTAALVGPPAWSTTVSPTQYTNSASLSFSGTTNHVSIPKTAELQLTTSTIALWLKADADVADYCSIFSDAVGGSEQSGYRCELHSVSGNFGCFVNGTSRSIQSATPLNDNAWHHVALVLNKSAGTASIYIDGMQNGAINVELKPSLQVLYLGQSSNLGIYPFLGLLDDLRIYNRALSAAEINLLAAGGGPDTVVRGISTAITVNAVASITVQPQNKSILSGQAATLSVTAIGDGTLAYQWYRGASGVTTSPIPGATGNSYVTPPLYGPESYWVRVSGTYGAPVDSVTALINTFSTLGTFGNSSAITINDNAAATPYPSGITVSGVTGPVEWVKVTLKGVNHTAPSDVGVLLEGPHGEKVVLMEGAGGTSDIVNVDLVFDDAGSALTTAAVIGGTYRPTNLNTARTFPAPAPAKPYGTSLTAFNNVSPNGEWKLYVRDASATDSGSISGWGIEFLKQQGARITGQPQSVMIVSGQNTTLSVTATGDDALNYQWYQGDSGDVSSPVAGATGNSYTTPPLYGPASYWVRVTDSSGYHVDSSTAQVVTTASKAVFNNSAAITINDNSAASPYPSVIAVSGFTGAVEIMRVALNGINHTWPADIGILLVGPRGQSVNLMSGAGGGVDIVNTDLVLDDTGSALTSAKIENGVYRPTSLSGPSYSFLSPAPAAPYGNKLELFNNTDPNGEWLLYVQDLATGDSGTIASGWGIEFLARTHSLRIATAGTGYGTVNYQEKPAVINTAYETSVATGQQVTLVPQPDQFSLFTGWSGISSCSTGICQFIMSQNTSVSGTFTLDSANSVLVDQIYHATIDDAYKADSTGSGSVIKLWGIDFAEVLLLGLDKTVTLSGNYDNKHSLQGSDTVTTISGSLSIKAGTVIVDRVSIK